MNGLLRETLNNQLIPLLFPIQSINGQIFNYFYKKFHPDL